MIHRTSASLRFFGDDLDPDEISVSLGRQPTIGVKRGGTWLNDRGREIVARRGAWRFQVERRSPGDLDAQIEELLASLTVDLDVWKSLASRFDADILCGVFLVESNAGIALRPETLVAVGSRGLTIDLDIYGSEMLDRTSKLSRTLPATPSRELAVHEPPASLPDTCRSEGGLRVEIRRLGARSKRATSLAEHP